MRISLACTRHMPWYSHKARAQKGAGRAAVRQCSVSAAVSVHAAQQPAIRAAQQPTVRARDPAAAVSRTGGVRHAVIQAGGTSVAAGHAARQQPAEGGMKASRADGGVRAARAEGGVRAAKAHAHQLACSTCSAHAHTQLVDAFACTRA
eukprot:356779-Chlamydomonas_euryale.AAC.1